MPLVFNKQTKYPEYVSSTILNDPKTKDNYESVDTHKFDMVDKEGKRFTVPGYSLEKAIQAGWRLELPSETEHANKVHEYLIKIDSSEMIGFENFMRGFSFEIYDILADHELTSEEKEAVEIAYRHHPIAHYGCYGLGISCSMILIYLFFKNVFIKYKGTSS